MSYFDGGKPLKKYSVRKLRHPDDYPAVASLLNLVWSEPTTAEQLEDVENKIPPGQLHYNEDGELMGWDRPKWVAEDEAGDVIAYAIAWRAPWTEPGALIHNVVVAEEHRGHGVGSAVYDVLRSWAMEVKASKLIEAMRESDERSLAFAEKRGYTKERHYFESVLDLQEYDGGSLYDSIEAVQNLGIQFVTLADEPGEANERKLYELYKVTHLDIPGNKETFPWFEEWKKWSIDRPGVRPEYIHIAKDGDQYVGVVTLQENEQTRGMYHEYTGVLREYRGRRIGLALKMLGVKTAIARKASYLKTHNDSMNAPMLRINRDLMGFRAEPGQYEMVCKLR